MRAIENQHRDDQALEEFERIEHAITRKDENAEIVTDLTERILPSATGNIKVEDGGKWSSCFRGDSIATELEFAVTALGLAMHPNDRYKEDLAKFEKRRHDHAELVDTATKAFRVTWAGRETRADSAGTRTLMKFLLDPEPELQAHQPVRGQFSAHARHALGGRSAGAIRAPRSRHRHGHYVCRRELPERSITAATS